MSHVNMPVVAKFGWGNRYCSITIAKNSTVGRQFWHLEPKSQSQKARTAMKEKSQDSHEWH